mgnify:CR=1 FL=1
MTNKSAETGLVKELEISLWDPLGLEKVASVDIPEFMLDGEAPELLSSNMASVVSRFHLESVDIGVNVREGQGWSAPLTLTCQVRSLDVEWDAATDNVGVTGYKVYIDNLTTISIEDSTNTTHRITGLAPNEKWRVFVRAYDAAGNYSVQSNRISVKLISPI